ncbi:hypothetical protein [Candidatus Tisiphia endosymbiont of Parasteatoda lunata]|uniref:hypothetical protein n=1 Tax=Candidatus Tisiphia endosymbiont of Parasteatoda lunata TaxID=3066275 RepID=UPI00313C8CDD
MSQHKKNISVKCKILLKKYLILSFLDKIFKIYVETTHCKCGVFLPKWDNKIVETEDFVNRSPQIVTTNTQELGRTVEKSSPAKELPKEQKTHELLSKTLGGLEDSTVQAGKPGDIKQEIVRKKLGRKAILKLDQLRKLQLLELM